MSLNAFLAIVGFIGFVLLYLLMRRIENNKHRRQLDRVRKQLEKKEQGEE